MAKKLGLGTILAVSAVAAAVGAGVAAYVNREALKDTVQNIADKLGVEIEIGENDLFDDGLDLDDDIVVHPVDKTDAMPESDFVDADGAAEEPDAPEAPSAEEA